MSNYRPNVLICPLDWGLGHTTRCIPIIYELLNSGAEVIIAADNNSIDLLKTEFPSLKYIFLKGYRVRFSDSLPLVFNLLLQLPRIILSIYREHFELKKILMEHDPVLVVSDNRYGLWNKKVVTVFICHQINPLPPAGFTFIAPLMKKISHWFIGKYDHCWVPDLAVEDSLTYRLSQGKHLPQNIKYIGYLSRFQKYNQEQISKEISPDILYDIVALVSGPEPQRSSFEKLLTNELQNHPRSCLLLRGLTSKVSLPDGVPVYKTVNNLTIVSHLSGEILFRLLNPKTGQKPIVICRAGYSSLMDLSFTGNRIICVPTPGQTEQEYLAKEGAQKGQLVYCRQRDFNLKHCLNKVKDTAGIKYQSNENIVKNEIKYILDCIKDDGVS